MPYQSLVGGFTSNALYRMKFSDYQISPELKDNLNHLGFKRPTDIQFKAIPYVLKGEDVLAVAQTGTGKTAAYGVPLINRLQQLKSKARRKDGLRALVLVPTHELAVQVDSVLQQLTRNTGVRSIYIHGGVDQAPQIAQLEKGAEVLVATPGRLFDLRSQGYIDLHRVETLVLDEADQMLARGFITDIRGILSFLPKRRQTLFFSATIDKDIKKLAYTLIQNNAIRIQIAPDNPVARNVFHKVGFIGMDDKRYFLERLYREQKGAKVLAFVRTKIRAERVKKAMERVDIDCLTLHGDKSQAQRSAALEAFKEGAVRLLIATDLSARGVDIPHVEYVVNYDLPEQAENYVHRIGRTGRGGDKGNAITFCSEQEKELLEEIEYYLGAKIDVLNIDKGEYEDTLDFTKDTRGMDWKALIEEDLKKIAEIERQYKKKKGKKRL
jgi:ATP-dependent RNA helicase RhlE